MTTNSLSPSWAGQSAAPIDPVAVRFKAAQAPVNFKCDGCLFIGQRASTCVRASELAEAAGQPDCDTVYPGKAGTVIYVADDSDPRQMALLGAAS